MRFFQFNVSCGMQLDSQNEINPVFLTACSSIYRFALCGDETAKIIVAFLEKDGPKELFRILGTYQI